MSSPRVAIDISYTYIGKGGVARYIQYLISSLREQQSKSVDLHEIACRLENFHFRQPERMAKTAFREAIWQPFIAPHLIRSLQCNVLHTTSTACINAPKGIPKVATLHDLAFRMTPERFRRWTRIRSHIELNAYRNADLLICVSNATADDAMRLLEIPSSKIVVIHHGCPFDDCSSESPPAEAIPPEFFLFVSSLESGKNLKLLNQAYRLADSSGRPLPQLIIVGNRVQGVPDEGPPPESWIYLGRVPDEVVVYLYRRSLALVYPSKFEGFGFPILEAMALGTAVICSPTSSLPEVGGTAPYYADQTPTAYLGAMRLVLTDKRLRIEKIIDGKQQARRFSWEKCANQTAQVYGAVRRQKK